METKSGTVTTLSQEEIGQLIENYVKTAGDHSVTDETMTTFQAEMNGNTVSRISATVETVSSTTTTINPLSLQPEPRSGRVESNDGGSGSRG